MEGKLVSREQSALLAAQASLDDLVRHDAGVGLARWFADDAQLLWPEIPAITGPAAIGQAFADFAAEFETISHAPDCTRVVTSRYAPDEVLG